MVERLSLSLEILFGKRGEKGRGVDEILGMGLV